MGIEKRGSNYVGGFLHLFDWNAKSRKKLMFSSKPDLPENSKQKKRFDGSSPTTRLEMMDEEEIGGASSVKGSSDYSCASSVTDEDVCAKGPGVVARLMGLNSMPKSSTIDPSSTPLFDCYYETKNLECHRDEEVSSNVVVMRPMEKFKTEVLPPKSAKSVPITRNKLLSPIKSTNFVPSKDKAEIMEAAARILETGPPRDSRKPKLHSKEKKVQKTTLRPSESSQKSKGNGANAKPMRILQDSEEESSSSSVKSKGRSISLALQAKANVQKREGLSKRRSVSVSNESSSPNMLFRSQKSAPNVLRQNNQKQNCGSDYSPSARRQNCSKAARKSNAQVKDDKRHHLSSSSSSERTHKKRSVEDKNREVKTDVISFTFTAPMRSNENSPNKRMMLNSDSFTFLGRNVKGGNTLSRYLEQQLEELAHKVDKSKNSTKDEKIDQERLAVSSSLYDAKGCRKMQGMCGINISDEQSFRLPSPVSVLERSSFTESCCSSDSTGASSTKRRSWELDYVNKILECDIGRMFNEYAMGITCDIINPNLFDQLERFYDCGPVSRTGRRVVFDCVGECLDRRYKKHGIGGPTLWVKGVGMLKQKDRLAKDVWREISGWSSMGDFMVDELVDGDMRSDPWLDYDVEGFEIGANIEARILNSLVDELVADILVL